jgi:1-deoxy-D-xylulose-5-phosphate synthase
MDNRQGYRSDVPARRLLDTINNPQELKKLPPELLPQLAEEIREKIISTVAKTGGTGQPGWWICHRPPLCFDCPRDKIVWDVGIRPIHKLLTGRGTGSTLRQRSGSAASPSAARAVRRL